MIKNMCIWFERWTAQTPADVVLIKLTAIGATVWLMWLVFAYLRRVAIRNDRLAEKINQVSIGKYILKSAFSAGFNVGQMYDTMKLTNRGKYIDAWFENWCKQNEIK